MNQLRTSAIDHAQHRNLRWKRYNRLFKQSFIAKEGVKYPARKVHIILLYLCKQSCSFENLADVTKFLLDIGHKMRYNKGKRYYKYLHCLLSDEAVEQAVQAQKNGYFNKPKNRR